MFLFIDADTVVNAAVVRAAVAAMQAGAAGGGSAFRFDGRVPFYGRALVAMVLPLFRVVGVASGCFLFCTRAAFWAAGGFDEQFFGGEEAVLSWRLHRQGRFVVVHESVTTSGRKLRAHSAWEVLSPLLKLAIVPSGIKRRKGLEIWYGERRADPGAVAGGRDI
jgi:GT2 family glycosyltransferase